MTIESKGTAGGSCANCGAMLHGPYCAECGQHAHYSARALGTLLHDGWHTLTHLDSRLWRTLQALLFRPGWLTVEYCADRRQRYLPPVRLYLIIALLFFALVGVGDFDREPEGASASGAAASAPAAPSHTSRNETLSCNFDAELNDRRWLKARAAAACRTLAADGGRELWRDLQSNIPRMMLLFLPVLAAICLLFYWRPRRLYVEHLTFFLHTHAALYLLALLVSLPLRLLRLTTLPQWPGSLLEFGVWVYALWYLFRAMRRVYAQGRALTLLKYLLIGASYCICLGAMLLLTFMVSLMQA